MLVIMPMIRPSTLNWVVKQVLVLIVLEWGVNFVLDDIWNLEE